LSVPRSLEGTLEARSSALGSVAREVELERSVRHQKFARRLIRLSAELLLLAALISLCFLRFPQVEGHSMQPNIETGNHVLINTLAYEVHIGGLVIGRHAINRGDVVAFPRRDADEQRLFLKRVVGLPGDAVAIRHGALLLNGARLPESYATMPDSRDMATVKIPSGSVFVLGDNRADSDDSRSFGPVPISSIMGKAVLIMWPLSHVKRIE